MSKIMVCLKKHSGIDILVTHAPAFKMNDGIDYPHQGFQAFQKIIDYWHPRFFCSWTYSFELWTRYEQSITI